MTEHHRHHEEEALPPFRHRGREGKEGSPFDQKEQQQWEYRLSTGAAGGIASKKGRTSTAVMGGVACIESLMLMSTLDCNLKNAMP
jgi:hypothetical protein